MNTNGLAYPRWEREGPVSRFFMIGGSIFVVSASGKADLVGQFESEKSAKEACVRNLADREKHLGEEIAGWGLNTR